MKETKILLTDEQMSQFIAQGYLKLNTDFSEQFHQSLHKKIKEIYVEEGNPGNNLLPRIPEIQRFFDHPTVTGALESILGPDYIMDAHRHGHYNRPGSKEMMWHKDDYWGNEKVRNHHPWYAMIFYYMQDVTEDMGPSSIMPGTQNYYNRAEDKSEYILPICGKAGTMALIDYDIWHTAMANRSDLDRFMLKFLFYRLEAPKQPEWNNQSLQYVPPQPIHPIHDHPLMWQSVWNWLSGNPDKTLEHGVELAEKTISQLASELEDKREHVALNAAYGLAAMGEKAIPTLIQALNHSSESVIRNAAYGLSAQGSLALKPLIDAMEANYQNNNVHGYIAFVLGELGESASSTVPKMMGWLQDDSDFVRMHVTEALGMIKEPVSQIVPALCERLKDDVNGYVRFTAGLALTRLGTKASEAVSALEQSLNDKDRYVSAIAACALERINSKEAMGILLPFLKTARWCPVTTVKSTY